MISGGATPGRARSNDLVEKQMTCLLTWLSLSSWTWQLSLSPLGLSSFHLTTCLVTLVIWQ